MYCSFTGHWLSRDHRNKVTNVSCQVYFSYGTVHSVKVPSGRSQRAPILKRSKSFVRDSTIKSIFSCLNCLTVSVMQENILQVQLVTIISHIFLFQCLNHYANCCCAEQLSLPRSTLSNNIGISVWNMRDIWTGTHFLFIFDNPYFKRNNWHEKCCLRFNKERCTYLKKMLFHL